MVARSYLTISRKKKEAAYQVPFWNIFNASVMIY